MQATRTPPRIVYAGAIAAAIVVNYFAFRAAGSDYLRWYIDEGGTIAAATALLAIVWGEIDRNEQLISADPRAYVSSCFLVVSLPLISLGTQLEAIGKSWKDARAAVVWDTLLAFAFVAVFLILLGAWFLVVAPLQYFVYLLCGALPRLLLRSPDRVIAQQVDGSFETRQIPRKDKVPDGWWDASFASKPVALTALFSSFVLFAVKAFSSP